MNKRYLHIVLFILIGIGFSDCITGQNALKKNPTYSFIDTTINKISYPNDGIALDHFFKKLDTLVKYGTGKLSIVHFGGSHIQADIISNQLRKNLYLFHPNLIGERGFIFPFTAAETNNPRNYITDYKGIWEVTKNTNSELSKPLGIGGIAITTNDSLPEITIKLRNAEEPKLFFSRVRIIGINKSNNYTPVVFTDSIQSFEGVYDRKSGSYVFDLQDSFDAFTLKLYRTESGPYSFTLQGIVLENDTPDLAYHSIGINGASIPSYLKCEYLERDIKLLKPDLVIFSIGINDAVGDDFNADTFKKNYALLIEKIKSVAPHTDILFTTNNDSYKKNGRKYYVNANGFLARNTFFEMGNTYQAGVWDLFSIMGSLHSMKNWEEAGLAAKDKIHFTREGYIILGDLLFNALIYDYITNYY